MKTRVSKVVTTVVILAVIVIIGVNYAKAMNSYNDQAFQSYEQHLAK